MSDSNKVPEAELLTSFPSEPPELTSRPAATAHQVRVSPARPPAVYDRWPKPKPHAVAPRQASTPSAAVREKVDGLHQSLDELRAVGAQLARAYGRLDEQYLDIEGRSTQALDALANVERRVGALDRLRDLADVIDERSAALSHIDADIERRTRALASQEAALADLETRVSLSVAAVARQVSACESRCAALNAPDGPTARIAATVTPLEARAQRLSEALAHREDVLSGFEHRLDDTSAAATALASALASIEARTATLSAQQTSLAATEQALTRAQQLAAEATAELRRVHETQAHLEETLRLTRGEARRVTGLSWALRVRARVAAWSHAGWSSARSADVPLGLAAAASTVVSTAMLVAWVTSRSVQSDAPVAEGNVATIVDQIPRDLAPRTTDIELPSRPARALTNRRAMPRPARQSRSR